MPTPFTKQRSHQRPHGIPMPEDDQQRPATIPCVRLNQRLRQAKCTEGYNRPKQ